VYCAGLRLRSEDTLMTFELQNVIIFIVCATSSIHKNMVTAILKRRHGKKSLTQTILILNPFVNLEVKD